MATPTSGTSTTSGSGTKDAPKTSDVPTQEEKDEQLAEQQERHDKLLLENQAAALEAVTPTGTPAEQAKARAEAELAEAEEKVAAAEKQIAAEKGERGVEGHKKSPPAAAAGGLS